MVPPGARTRLLLHVCCAPCSAGAIPFLEEEGLRPSLFWYNPNIHPWTEYKARRDALAAYAGIRGLPLIMEDVYGLREFVAALGGGAGREPAGGPAEGFSREARCPRCYRSRMERTVAAARAGGFDAFCSTLFISPYQDHELLRKTAEAAAERYGVRLFYRDFRPGFRRGQGEARRLGLYAQKYCGCLFSEEERYLGTAPA
ncbi:MAG: epoxyqueuosine reductase QueH [Treponema sp.]|jgi:predicted adenine nucleotide alpha hydrolase (AANH) superfamily ATPase|nr:epoxyqueuosine reductase QueH [Treponema sp.]